MKLKFIGTTLANLAFSMALFVVASPSLHASSNQKIANKDASKNATKDALGSPYYSATDAQALRLFPARSDAGSFTPLTFTQHIHQQGKSIRSNGEKFRLKKGTYLVTFSGTFQVVLDSNVITIDDAVFFNTALQLGSQVIFVNTDSHEVVADNVGVSSFSKVIEIHEPTDLLIIARQEITFPAEVLVTERSIFIRKFK